MFGQAKDYTSIHQELSWISPVSGHGLHQAQGRDSRRISPHDAWAQGDGNDKGLRFQQGFFIVGKAAFRAYQNGGWYPYGFEAHKGIEVDFGLVTVDQ